MKKDSAESRDEVQSAASSAASDSQETRAAQHPPLESNTSDKERPGLERPDRPSRSSLEEDTRKYLEQRAERERLGVGRASNTQGIAETPPNREGYSYMWVHDDSKFGGRDIAKAVLEGYRPVPHDALPPIYQAMYQGVDGVARNGDLMLYEILQIQERDNRERDLKARDALNSAAQEKIDAKDADGNRLFTGLGVEIARSIESIPGTARVPNVEDNVFNK